MSTFLLALVAFLVLLVLFFATGKKAPSRPVGQLPEPSNAVRLLAREGKAIEAIKLYRKEAGASLREAKHVVDGIRD